MGKTLLSEVMYTVESNLEGVSGEMVKQYRRLDKLYTDLQGVRPVMDEAMAGTRTTNINGLFFGGVLNKAFREATEISGALGALVSLATGLTGTVLDRLMLEAFDALKSVWAALKRASYEISETGVADYIYRHSHDPGWKGIAWQIVEDLAFPVLGPEPPEYKLLDMKEGESADPTPSMGTLNVDLVKVSENLTAMHKFIEEDKTLNRVYAKFDGIKDLEKSLFADPANTLKNFWVGAITSTEGWQELTGGT